MKSGETYMRIKRMTYCIGGKTAISMGQLNRLQAPYMKPKRRYRDQSQAVKR